MDVLFGKELKRQRQSAGLSQDVVSRKTGVSRRSLIRWEQCEVLPRSYELNLVTTFLKKQLERRNLSESSSGDSKQDPPSPQWAELFQVQQGDLLRSLRLRRKRTPKWVADQIGVSYSTYMRWEQSKTDPSEDTWDRLFHHLQATESEILAIQHLRSHSRSRLTPRTLSQMREFLYRQDETLHALQFAPSNLPTELLLLDQQAKLCSCLSVHPDFKRLLGRVLTYRGLYLSARGRQKEAVFYAQSGLQCLSAFSPEHQWLIGFWVARGIRRQGRMKWLFSWAEGLSSPALQIEALCQLCDCAIEDSDYETAGHFMGTIQQVDYLSHADEHLRRRVQSSQFALALVQRKFDEGFTLYESLLGETEFPVEKALLLLHGVALEQLAGDSSAAHRSYSTALEIIEEHSLENLRDFAKLRESLLT